MPQWWFDAARSPTRLSFAFFRSFKSLLLIIELIAILLLFCLTALQRLKAAAPMKWRTWIADGNFDKVFIFVCCWRRWLWNSLRDNLKKNFWCSPNHQTFNFIYEVNYELWISLLSNFELFSLIEIILKCLFKESGQKLEWILMIKAYRARIKNRL